MRHGKGHGKDHGKAAEIRVRLQPRARRSEIVGERDGALVVRVVEPPVDGRANDALRRLIAKRLRVSPGRVTIAHGAGSRDKVIRIEDADPESVAVSLGLPSG
jgi:uncharacterized protein (TIGR00251 family)